MIIKRLHILIIKHFFLLFIPSLFITIFVLILQFIWVYADDLIGKGLDFGVLLELIYYLSLMNFTLALPIAVMLASIMTFGDMGEHFELTAAKSAGISLYRIMVPIFALAIIFSLTSFIFANNVFPYSTLKTYSLVASIRQQHPALRIQEGIFNYDVEGYVIRVGEKSKSSNMMYDFMIYDHTNYQGNKFVIVSDSGTVGVTPDLKFMILNLYDGFQYEELKDKQKKDEVKEYPYHIDDFSKQQIIIPLKGFNFEETEMSMFSQNYNMLNVKQLQSKIDSLNDKLESKISYYLRVILNNDLFKNHVKLKTKTDTVNYLDKYNLLLEIPAQELIVNYDIDSAMIAQSKIDKKNIYRAALKNAENLSNRLNIFTTEYESRRDWLVNHQIAYHKKFVFAFACFIFFFIGAPLGTIIRKGGFGLPTIISVVLFLIFYIIIVLGERYARNGATNSFVGVWFAVFIFVPLEIFLFYKAATDSVIVNYDYYVEIITKFVRKFTPNFLRRRKFRKIREKKILRKLFKK